MVRCPLHFIVVTNYPAPVGEIQQSSPTAEALGLGGLTRPLRIRCYNCGQMGHISYDCQSPQVRKTCFSCGNAGHLSRDCPERLSKAQCNHCQQVGHFAKQCPILLAKQSGKEAETAEKIATHHHLEDPISG